MLIHQSIVNGLAVNHSMISKIITAGQNAAISRKKKRVLQGYPMIAQKNAECLM